MKTLLYQNLPDNPTMERRITQLRGDSVNGFLGTPSRFPLKRPIPANPNSLSFVERDQTVRSEKRVKLPQREERRVIYHEFLKLDQAGPAVICSGNTSDCSIVAIKRSKVKAQNNTFKIPSVCSNVVELIEVFDKDGGTHMVYEQMDVSLRLINSIPRLQWNEHEIAAVCKEVSYVGSDLVAEVNRVMQVLCGLSFIHQGLSHYYGELDCTTVLLNRDGHIKLGLLATTGLRIIRLTARS